MASVKLVAVAPDQHALKVEIAHLRDLDLAALRARWKTVFRRQAPPHLPRHLLYRIVAYRLQADHLGDIDDDSRRLLDAAASPEAAGQRAMARNRISARIRPGAVLAREWNGRMHRVTVLDKGFAWNGTTYPSLSQIASAITGTRWNGPRFFGLRDRAIQEAAE